MKYVLDASFFFYDRPAEGELYTTPSVVDELEDLRSKSRFDVLCAGGLTVAEPSAESKKTVTAAAHRTGDAGVISETDRDVLALALDLSAAICTDDFAVHNIARELTLRSVPMQQRMAKKRTWRYRCRGCGRYFDRGGECPVCGSELKRTLK
jgi:UPF0271 protein